MAAAAAPRPVPRTIHEIRPPGDPRLRRDLFHGLSTRYGLPETRGATQVSARAKGFFREGLLFLAAALALCLPGAALFVYREMPADDGDWRVRCVPTCLGGVDPRRFWAFSLGRCALADDGYYDPALGSKDWPWTGAVLHPPRVGAGREDLALFDDDGSDSDDGGGLV